MSTDERAKCAPCARRGCDRTSETGERKRDREKESDDVDGRSGDRDEARDSRASEAERRDGDGSCALLWKSCDSRAGRELLSFSRILVHPRAIQRSIYWIWSDITCFDGKI